MSNKTFTLVFFLLFSINSIAQREIIILNGDWEIEESVQAEKRPVKFTHKVQVPGLVNTSIPGFNNQKTFIVCLKLPETPGSYMLYTYAVNTDGSKTLCRRRIKVVI